MIWILPLAALIIGLTLQRRGTGGGSITGTGASGPTPSDPLLDLLRRATGTPTGTQATTVQPAYTPPGGAIPQGIPTGTTVPTTTTTTTTPPSTDAPRVAAQGLRDYYLQGGRDRALITQAQRIMGSVTVDGLVGPQTRARARALGVDWQEPTGTPSGTPSGTSVPTSAQGQDMARTAAITLRDYYNGGGRSVPVIRGHQGVMGGIAADGSVGPQTRGRARALGVDWPEPSGTGTPYTLPTVAPGSIPTTPVETGLAQGAAQRVRDYYQGGGRDRATIQQAQWAMGGITADGLVGPQTRARARALGVSWPD